MADTNLLVLAREYKKLREEVKKVLSMPKGDKGDQGEKGEKGDTGDTGPQGFPGRDGKDGINGYDGKEGRDGVDGKDGKDGLDGVGVANAYIDFDNSLVIVLTDGREVNAGFLSQETKDNVVATFKQGAQTLNELLPAQTGNAGKFLTTDGTNTSWATVSGGGGGSGTVTSVASGTGLTGGPITTSGTLSIDTAVVATLSGTQTLTNKTLTTPTITGAVLNDGYTEEVFTITDGTTINLDPNNGSIQTWTLGANRTPGQANWASGQSIVLQVDDGTAYTIDWSTLSVVWKTDGGVAPTLQTTGITAIVLWKVSTTIYGARVGNA
jgi:hypothetical protein